MRRHAPGRVSPIMPKIARYLVNRGCDIDVVYPEDGVTDLGRVQVDHDLYVLKSGTELALGLAGALDGLGASILSPYGASVRCRDKVIAAQVMLGAGVPTPETFVAADPILLAPVLEDGPLVVKPYRGSGGEGVRVIRTATELVGIPRPKGLVFAQRYREPEGRDRKIYRIGDEVYGVKRVWPPSTYEEKLGEPFTLSAEEVEVTMRCGRAFGMEVYGLDIVISAGDPYVVDISSFPGFKGVPEAARRLADHIHATAVSVRGGGPLMLNDRHGTGLEGRGLEMTPGPLR